MSDETKRTSVSDDLLPPIAEALENLYANVATLELPDRLRATSTRPSTALGDAINGAERRLERARVALKTYGRAGMADELDERCKRILADLRKWEDDAHEAITWNRADPDLPELPELRDLLGDSFLERLNDIDDDAGHAAKMIRDMVSTLRGEKESQRGRDAADDKLFTIQEVADKFKCNKRTVERWISGGQLTAVQVGKERGRRVRQSDLDKLLSQ